MKRRFPIFLGNPGYTTNIQIFELDTVTGNIGVGGTSSDVTILSTANRLFIGILKSAGFDFLWVNELAIVG
jgi:hypothetical protein